MATYTYWVEPVLGDEDRGRIVCSCGRRGVVLALQDAQRSLDLFGGNSFRHTHRKAA